MKEEELEKLIKLKYDAEKVRRYTKQWLDYTYDKNRTRYEDEYYTVKIQKDYDNETELTIHLPTIVNAMEKFANEKEEIYRNALQEGDDK